MTTSAKSPVAKPTEPPDRRPPDSLRDPEWTKAQLLAAARDEFSEKGLSGARVNAIAARAGVNKQLLYYYFGDKERLYATVLEEAYADIRAGEQKLDLDALAPIDAMRTFIEFNFDYMVENQHFVALLSDENVHRARHVRDAGSVQGLHERLRGTIGDTLERGLADGSFKRRVDPVDLYLSIASLCYFHLSNRHTLSAIFDRDLSARDEIGRRREHVIELLICYLTTPSEAA